MSFGPVIADGEIRYLSPSQLEKFDEEVFGGCQRRWWFRYVQKKPEPQTKSAKLGDQVHSQNEHYLKTGEDVLGEIARAGKRFLPKPGPDLLVEYQFARAEGGRVFSPLMAAGVPFIGKIDLLHNRGEWVDDDGVVRPEPGVPEVHDHKTTKQIENKKDPQTGAVISRGYAKTGDELAATWQMGAYAEVARLEWPNAPAVRVSHGYLQTQGPRAASKRSALVPVDHVIARWRRAEPLVEQMKAAARATDVKSVKPNYSACNAYGGCPHKAYCPRSTKQLLNDLVGKGSSMSLRSRLGMGNAPAQTPSKTVVTGTQSPISPEVAAEMEKLKAEEAARKGGVLSPDSPAPSKIADPIPADAQVSPAIRAAADEVAAAGASLGSCSDCGNKLEASNTSKLTTGAVKHVGCPKNTTQTAAPSAPPLSAAPAGPCPESGQTRELDADALVSKKHTCKCGVVLPLKGGSKPNKMGDGKYYSVLPAHDTPAPKPFVYKVENPDGSVDEVTQIGETETRKRIKEAPAQIAPAPAAPAVVTPAPQTAPEGKKTEEKAAPEEHLAKAVADAMRTTHIHVRNEPGDGFDLYLDASEDGVPTERLETYADKLCASLCNEYKAADVRCAPEPLAFGKWRGALAAFAKESPPPAGAYAVSSKSEIAMVVFEALAPRARRVVRGS